MNLTTLTTYSTFHTPYAYWGNNWQIICQKTDNGIDWKNPLFLLFQNDLTSRVFKYRTDYHLNTKRKDGYINPYPEKDANTLLLEENTLISDLRRQDDELLNILEKLLTIN